ncbi:hypothetical protein NEF87_000538 [Candidatus Lokiarchaeum ossiferum]|uniref:HTH cro/C1-type domain-containing protein n=1 Tax=Candidatus Lokiarchaeum ossiferum TaxID=2951803 RepID=A0ABY6HLT5_9ARCH|nr:hypothetical protein NEF87_000538 [Candidatus Lokiarchaeum sp. B-35]
MGHTFEPVIGTLESSYVKKQLIATTLAMAIINLSIIIMGWVMQLVLAEQTPNGLWTVILLIVAALFIIPVYLAYLFGNIYIKNFSYEISEQFIVIKRGVFARTKTSIPFSRVQNVNVHQSLLDRWLNLFTIKIETAGAVSLESNALSEGYIPALSDPTKIEATINKLIHQYTQDVPEKVQDKIFTDNNLAFDEFIAYILAKMTEGDEIKTRIRELRKENNMSQVDLADALGVSRQTISSLETGKYMPSLKLAMKISRVFKIPIEEIFEMEDEEE